MTDRTALPSLPIRPPRLALPAALALVLAACSTGTPPASVGGAGAALGSVGAEPNAPDGQSHGQSHGEPPLMAAGAGDGRREGGESGADGTGVTPAPPDEPPVPSAGTGAGEEDGERDERLPVLPAMPIGGPADTAPSTPLACEAEREALRERALALINTVRASARSCGGEAFDAAPSLGWDTRLEDAARAHSTDMATHDFFSHTGSDGGSVGQRVDGAAYGWGAVGENIAAGQPDLGAAIDGWVGSAGHCRNLMNPRYTDVAIACVADDGAQHGRYWTNVLARPL